MLNQKFNVGAPAILLGWQAGSEFAALSRQERPSARAPLDGAWRLIRSRFSVHEIGEITSYTLNYLSGFAKAAAARNYRTGNGLDEKGILAAIQKDAGVVAIRSLLDGLSRTLLRQLVAFAHNGELDKRHPDAYSRVVDGYSSFIDGFVAGGNAAADQVFADVFRLGYGYGYDDGFRHGYIKGYADGSRDGYAAGFREAWYQANSKIDQLERQLNDSSGPGWLTQPIQDAQRAVDIAQKAYEIGSAISLLVS